MIYVFLIFHVGDHLGDEIVGGSDGKKIYNYGVEGVDGLIGANSIAKVADFLADTIRMVPDLVAMEC